MIQPLKKYILGITTALLLILLTNTFSQPVFSQTAATTPPLPIVTRPDPAYMNVNPIPGTGNTGDTLMAIYMVFGIYTCDGSNGTYIAANGSANGATAVWQNDATWGTVSVTGLNPERFYKFCVKAKNGAEGTESAFSSTAYNNGGYIPIAGDYVVTTSTGCTNRYPNAADPGRYVCGVDYSSGSGNSAEMKLEDGTFTLLATETLVVGILKPDGGSLIIPTGAEMKIGSSIFVPDADNDGYPDSTSVYVDTTPPPNTIRKYLMTTLAETDCNSGSYSTTNTCTLANGVACSEGVQCTSGFCTDGVCCNSACNTATCQICNSNSNAGAGTCGYVKTAIDPDNECTTGTAGGATSCKSASCSGTGTACGYITAGTTCRASAGACDIAETCNGSSFACPADDKQPNGTTCRASAGACDIAETCNGTDNDCPGVDAKSTAVCRASAGACDITESCNGINDTCPTDTFQASNYNIGASTNCQKCTGSAATPINQISSEDLWSECTSAYTSCSGNNKVGPDGYCNGAGACKTDGLSSACPTKGTCQTGGGCSAGSCVAITNQSPSQDLYNECTATSDTCSGDNLISGANGLCNGSGACDPGGSSSACPTRGTCQTGGSCSIGDGGTASCITVTNQSLGQDLYNECGVAACAPGYCEGDGTCYQTAAGTVCRASGGDCDPAENCDGVSGGCPTNVYSSSLCRAAAGICDIAEYCSGSSVSCPADAKLPAGQQSCPTCRYCNGSGNTCNLATGYGYLCATYCSSGTCCAAAQSCPTCRTSTSYVPNGTCGTTTCSANCGTTCSGSTCCPAAQSCPVCRAGGVSVPNGSCGTTWCASNCNPVTRYCDGTTCRLL